MAAHRAATRGHRPVPPAIWPVKTQLRGNDNPAPRVSRSTKRVKGWVVLVSRVGRQADEHHRHQGGPEAEHRRGLGRSPNASPTPSGTAALSNVVRGETTLMVFATP